MEIISFVILHYGDSEITDRCVQSICSMEGQEADQLVIVDNDIGKKDALRFERKKKYEQQAPNITVLINRGSGGFSEANNLGYQYARDRLKASFILVLNNDIEFIQKDFPTHLYQAYQECKCHVLGPDIIRSGTGEHQNPMDERLRTTEEAEATIRKNRMALKLYPLIYPLLYWNNRWMERTQTQERKKSKDYYKSKKEKIVPFGACLIFTPLFVKAEEKAFDPETQFYYEEYILACRCQKKGYRIVYDPSLKMHHESGKATSRRFRGEYGRLKFMMERIIQACKIYCTMLKK